MGQDVLSDVLRTVRLSGAIFYEVRAGEPWVTESPPGAWLVSRVLPRAQHMIAYHVVTRGTCWTALAEDGAEPVRLSTGSIVLYPHGDAHVMSSEPGMRTEPVLDGHRLPGADETLPFYVDYCRGEPETVRVLCGFLGCDVQPFNPLIQALPPLMHVTDGSARGALGSLIQATVAESSTARIGGSSVLSRLSELLFIEAVRCHMESLPDSDRGWLGGLVDPCVGRVLRLLHADPGRAWTLHTLAREAGFSKTVLVERFTRRLGVAPMAYLLKWRMQIAASLLTDSTQAIARVSAAVGYGSDEAFSRAFKRCTGSSPAEWRKRAATAENIAELPSATDVGPGSRPDPA